MPTRQCGPCTACCEGWLTSEKMKLKPGSPCQHCSGDGCGIYDTRPEIPCRKFHCAWLDSDTVLPDEMRPDLSGAIVMFDRRWKGIKVITAVPTGEKIPAETLDRLRTFAKINRVPLIFCRNPIEKGAFGKTLKIGFGPPDFVTAVKKAIGGDDVVKF